MHIDPSKKTEITLNLLQDLIAEMKGTAGTRLKPKSDEPEAPEGKATEKSLEEHLDNISKEDHQEPDLDDLLSDDDEDNKEEDEEDCKKPLARSRMDRLLAK